MNAPERLARRLATVLGPGLEEGTDLTLLPLLNPWEQYLWMAPNPFISVCRGGRANTFCSNPVQFSEFFSTVWWPDRTATPFRWYVWSLISWETDWLKSQAPYESGLLLLSTAPSLLWPFCVQCDKMHTAFLCTSRMLSPSAPPFAVLAILGILLKTKALYLIVCDLFWSHEMNKQKPKHNRKPTTKLMHVCIGVDFIKLIWMKWSTKCLIIIHNDLGYRSAPSSNPDGFSLVSVCRLTKWCIESRKCGLKGKYFF